MMIWWTVRGLEHPPTSGPSLVRLLWRCAVLISYRYSPLRGWYHCYYLSPRWSHGQVSIRVYAVVHGSAQKFTDSKLSSGLSSCNCHLITAQDFIWIIQLFSKTFYIIYRTLLTEIGKVAVLGTQLNLKWPGLIKSGLSPILKQKARTSILKF